MIVYFRSYPVLLMSIVIMSCRTHEIRTLLNPFSGGLSDNKPFLIKANLKSHFVIGYTLYSIQFVAIHISSPNPFLL